MLTRLMGLVLPYERRSDGPLSGSQGGVHAYVNDRAFGSEALAAVGTQLRINHVRAVDGAALRLIAGHAGIYVLAQLPDSAHGREILAARTSWAGFSISMPRGENSSQPIDWRTGTQHITHVAWLDEVSLILRPSSPAWQNTWATSDLTAGIARMKAEEHARLVDAFGSDYRSATRSTWWKMPRQSAAAEAVLCAQDPERAFELQVGAIPW
jgi:hypothetical protein